MGLGSFLAVVAFVVTGIIQMKINPDLPNPPGAGLTNIQIGNFLPCNISVTLTDEKQKKWGPQYIGPYDAHPIVQDKFNKFLSLPAGKIAFDISTEDDCPNFESITNEFKFDEKSEFFIAVAQEKRTIEGKGKANYRVRKSDLKKPAKGFGEFKVNVDIFDGGDTLLNKEGKFAFCKNLDEFGECREFSQEHTAVVPYSPQNGTEFQSLRPGSWHLFLPYNESDFDYKHNSSLSVILQGGIFEAAVWYNESGGHYETGLLTLVGSNKLHMFWQLPQYFIISVGEILFSISGLEFSYSQAPVEMKSVMQAIWLLSVAVGDLLIIFVLEGVELSDQSILYFIFAGVLLVVTIVFVFLAHFWYTYVSYAREPADEHTPLESSPPGMKVIKLDDDVGKSK